MKLKPLDYIALLISISVLIIFSISAYRNIKGTSLLHIKSTQGEYYYPIAENKEYSVQGAIGTTTVAVTGGRVSVLESPCREKLCIKQGAIAKPGEWIACLPNSVLISIEAKNDEQWDSISY